jgi:murein L,D-transpeptidase YafK
MARQKALAACSIRDADPMAAKDTSSSAPILLRAFKESELEVWKKTRQGRYVLLKTFPICRWSGQLGPRSDRATGRRRRGSTRSGRGR